VSTRSASKGDENSHLVPIHEEDSVGQGFVKAVVALAAIFQVGTGAWAFFAPESFYDTIATFPPYMHFLHDIGAFLIGIGVSLAGALLWRDALFVVLLAGAVAASFHWVSHLLDHDLGGAASDPWTLGVFALLLIAALVLRSPLRSGNRSAQARTVNERLHDRL
jgi:hypothetical protein